MLGVENTSEDDDIIPAFKDIRPATPRLSFH